MPPVTLDPRLRGDGDSWRMWIAPVPRRRPGPSLGAIGWEGQTSRTASQLGPGLRRGTKRM